MTDDLTPDPGLAADSAPTAPPAIPSTAADLTGADRSLLGLVDRLAVLLERSELTELEVEAGATGLVLRKVALRTAGSGGDSGSTSAASPATHGSAEGVAVGPGAEVARPSVKAPLTGIFYGSPAPGSANYVQVGGEVAIGQVIGLIEAMKLFNEIKSDLAGRVVRVVAESGQLVKARQPLVEVDPL